MTLYRVTYAIKNYVGNEVVTVLADDAEIAIKKARKHGEKTYGEKVTRIKSAELISDVTVL